MDHFDTVILKKFTFTLYTCESNINYKKLVMYCERASSNYRTTIGCYWRHLVYSHSLLVHSQSRGQAILEYLAHVYALSPIGEVFFLFKKVNTKKPFMMESDPMTLFLQSTTIDTAGGLTIDCNLFTMARVYQDSVGDKTCSTKDFGVNTWEFHSLSSTLDGEHFFGAPQSK